jgi:hypothetical protein
VAPDQLPLTGQVFTCEGLASESNLFCREPEDLVSARIHNRNRMFELSQLLLIWTVVKVGDLVVGKRTIKHSEIIQLTIEGITVAGVTPAPVMGMSRAFSTEVFLKMPVCLCRQSTVDIQAHIPGRLQKVSCHRDVMPLVVEDVPKFAVCRRAQLCPIHHDTDTLALLIRCYLYVPPPTDAADITQIVVAFYPKTETQPAAEVEAAQAGNIEAVVHLDLRRSAREIPAAPREVACTRHLLRDARLIAGQLRTGSVRGLLDAGRVAIRGIIQSQQVERIQQ